MFNVVVFFNRTPGISNQFVLSKEDELKKRPKFNAIVKGSKNLGGCKATFDWRPIQLTSYDFIYLHISSKLDLFIYISLKY